MAVLNFKDYMSEEDTAQVQANRQAEAVKPLKDDLPKLTQNDLRESPEAIETIRAYMDERFGIDEISNYTDDELVTAYVNKMRRFHAGQSVATLGEVSWLHKADPDSKTVAGNAYALFDRMENIFTGERSTFLERLDGVYDYARAAIVDPTNLIGFGAGRLVATAGTKSAAAVAKKLAIDAAQKGIMKKDS